jgi:hypothetical protein
VEPAGYTPVSAAANLRRSIGVSAVVGVLAIVALSVAGHPLMGVFGCVGLALGALANWLLQRSMLKYAVDDTMTMKRFRHGAFRRLGGITLIAVGCAVLVQPDGLATVVGLAVFHVIMLIGAAVPVLRSLRPVA